MKVDFKKFLVALFLLFCLDLHIAKVFPDSGWDLEDMDFAEDISEAKMEELANSNATRAADGSSDSEAAAFLAAFVSEPLWEQTYSPRGRDALYLTPQMRNFKPRFFSTHLFYNETDRVNITVGDAFSLEFQSEEQRQQFFELLAKFVPGVPTDQTASDLAMLANLLQKIGVKERKAGGLFKGGFKIGRASFGVDFSIYLSERNLASDASTEEQIRQIIISNLSSGDSVPEIDLEAEFVRQRFGLGDTRLSLGVDAIRLTDFKSTIGVSAIVPTAVGVLLDGHFRKPSEPQLEGFGIPIRDMRDVLLNPELGNTKGWGFGLFMDSQLSLLKDKGRIWSKILFEDFLPKKEKKLILFKKTIEPQQLEDDDGLLEDFERQYLSPTTFETLVNSGSVLMISLCGDYKIKKNIRFGLGYDFYRKQREEIEKVYKVLSGSNIGSSVNINELNLGAAENLQAVQHKLLTELDFRVNVNKTKLHLGVGGDYTFSNKNIGRDWTLFGKLAFKF